MFSFSRVAVLVLLLFAVAKGAHLELEDDTVDYGALRVPSQDRLFMFFKMLALSFVPNPAGYYLPNDSLTAPAVISLLMSVVLPCLEGTDLDLTHIFYFKGLLNVLAAFHFVFLVQSGHVSCSGGAHEFACMLALMVSFGFNLVSACIHRDTMITGIQLFAFYLVWMVMHRTF